MRGRRISPLRLLAALATVLLAGGAAAFAYAARTPSQPPAIELDSGGPLFTLQGMQPGDVPVERCIALTARGGAATRLDVSGSVAGPLAQRLRMDVAAGAGPAPGTAHGCAGFAVQRQLWSGTLAEFPGEGAPAVSGGELAAEQSRVFRFRVWLPADAVVGANDTARQNIRWRAELAAPEDAPPATTPRPQPAAEPSPAATAPTAPPAATTPTGPTALPVACRGARRCRGRLIARLTPRGGQLHLRIHARGDIPIRSVTLQLPATLGAGSTRLALRRTRTSGTVVNLVGSVRARGGPPQRLLSISRLPATTRTILVHVRVPAQARPGLVRAGCRRSPVLARLTTTRGRSSALTTPLWIGAGDCRRQPAAR